MIVRVGTLTSSSTATGEGGSAAGNSANIQQFFDRLITLPSSGRQATYATFIDGLVTDDVWAKLDALYLFAAADESTALSNLIQASYTGARNSSAGDVTFTADSGYSGSGGTSRQVTSNFNPTTASSPNFVQNDALFGIWSGTTANVAQYALGYSTGAPNQTTQTALVPKWTNNISYFNINGGTEVASAANAATDGAGLFLGQRTAANAEALYRNGSLVVSSSNASAAPVNSKISVTPACILRALVIGRSLTAGERTALYDRLTTYLTAVVGSVP